MERIQSLIRRIFNSALPLPAGLYHFQSPPGSTVPLRLHLRLDQDGTGVLIVNASTVLHLNQTAAEMAYYLIQKTPENEVGQLIAGRYRIGLEDAQQDFLMFKERLETLLKTPDLDPVGFLDFGQANLHSGSLAAPNRIDCALTYHLAQAGQQGFAPTARANRELSTQEWQTILQKAWQAGIPHVVFTGGEPTLRPDLPELVSFAEQLGMVAGLLTDGLQFAETTFLQKIMNSGLDHLMILIDIQNELSWQVLQKAMSEDIFVVAHLTIDENNAESIPMALNRLAASGLRKISLSAISPDLKPTLLSMADLAAEKGLSLVWDLPVPYSGYNPVAMELPEEEQIKGAGKAWIYVEPDGDVLPGQGILQKMGNLLSNSWDEVWANRPK